MKRGVKYLWEGGEGGDRHNTRRGEEREKEGNIQINKKGTKSPEISVSVGGGGERKRKYFRKAEQSKDILNKHQDAIEKMVRKMADRPVCGFRWKRHHENHKQLCRVSQAQLHIGYKSCHSKQLASRRSVSLMLVTRTGALQTIVKPTNKQTDTAGWAAADAHCSFTVDRHGLYAKKQFTLHDVIWLFCDTFYPSVSLMLNLRQAFAWIFALPLKDKDSNIFNLVIVNKVIKRLKPATDPTRTCCLWNQRLTQTQLFLCASELHCYSNT